MLGFGDLKLEYKIMSLKTVDHTFVSNLTMLIQKLDSSQPWLGSPRETNSLVFDLQGYVAFEGGAKGGKITGKGPIKTGKLDFEDVYFVKELQFNLFSVSKMCDKKNSVLFTDSVCFVLSPNFKLADESQVLLKVSRKNNVYSFDMKNIVPQKDLTCLLAKAINDESMLWHRRLERLGKFVGYSTISKAFRVYNTRTRKIEENMHITFLENKPMIVSGGPEWLFDIDALLKSINYAPIPADLDGHNKDKHGPSQESECDTQERPNVEGSTKTVNTAGLVNTSTPTYADYPSDPLIHNLEDTRIFYDAYDDKDKGEEADYNNLERVISVSPIPSTREHKDHPNE
uniref:Putative ribonuclease H-like domain-containing protein n=1 Tax=Tanacetum cinerariifolium TaxID=118510 RepID=A0A699GWH0_TANCI|nr:putative ribonuclease H-like domain-containing protein [Tanacetum cinerariifolium]